MCIEREIDRERERETLMIGVGLCGPPVSLRAPPDQLEVRDGVGVPLQPLYTPSPPTKSLGFEGFDSSRLLILRGGNSHVRIN